MSTFCEYISPEFSIIFIIQQENKQSYYNVLYISSKSLSKKADLIRKKISMIFGFNVKEFYRISYYIFNFENISDQCYL